MPNFDALFVALADFSMLLIPVGDLRELSLFNTLETLELFTGLENGLNFLNPKLVLLGLTVDLTISLIVLSILPLLHILVVLFKSSTDWEVCFIVLLLLVLVLLEVREVSTPVLEKFTRILPDGK